MAEHFNARGRNSPRPLDRSPRRSYASRQAARIKVDHRPGHASRFIFPSSALREESPRHPSRSWTRPGAGPVQELDRGVQELDPTRPGAGPVTNKKDPKKDGDDLANGDLTASAGARVGELRALLPKNKSAKGETNADATQTTIPTSPGVWEQDGELHFDTVAILKSHGVESENPTPEEIDADAGRNARYRRRVSARRGRGRGRADFSPMIRLRRRPPAAEAASRKCAFAASSSAVGEFPLSHVALLRRRRARRPT